MTNKTTEAPILASTAARPRTRWFEVNVAGPGEPARWERVEAIEQHESPDDGVLSWRATLASDGRVVWFYELGCLREVLAVSTDGGSVSVTIG